MKKIIAAVASSLALTTPVIAENDAAEAMVASMRIADISYRDLMNMLSYAMTQMQDGVIRQNPELVKQGANVVFTHPAPREKPWNIMEKQDHDGFKQALLSYDVALDLSTDAVVKAAEKRDWPAAMSAVGQLQGVCVSCHSQWKDKAQR